MFKISALVLEFVKVANVCTMLGTVLANFWPASAELRVVDIAGHLSGGSSKNAGPFHHISLCTSSLPLQPREGM